MYDDIVYYCKLLLLSVKLIFNLIILNKIFTLRTYIVSDVLPVCLLQTVY